MNRLEPAPGVWVQLTRGAPPTDLCTAHDRAGAAALPAWRARERLAGRAALRALLHDLAPDAARADVRYTPRGRPSLAGAPDVGVSVSHDRDTYAACVALDRAVGVDVQHPPEALTDAMLRRCVRTGVAALAALDRARRAEEFGWVWTVQEACVKAAGTGLAGAPWRIDVPPLTRSGTWGRYSWVSLPNALRTPVSCAFTTAPGAGPRPGDGPDEGGTR